MGVEILSPWERFHHETKSIVVWAKLGPEYLTEPVRKAIRESPDAHKRLVAHGEQLVRAIRGK